MNKIYSCFIVLFYFIASPCLGEDKNGVSPGTISLPSGPGSIEGLGASFQPMLNTGSARYSVPIKLPEAAAGSKPNLTLHYDSGKGDGPLGIGWSIGPGSISRQVDKGIPRYVDSANLKDDDLDGQVDEADELDAFTGPDGEELVAVGGDIFRARIEGSFVRYRKTGDYWEADVKDGTTLQFGRTIQARETDETGQKIFHWLLEKSTDPNGNVIEYFYTDLPGSKNTKYLSEIRYGGREPPWSTFYFVRFTYEGKPDWRINYLSGFPRKTAHRLKQIDIGIQGADPAQCLPGDWNLDTVSDNLIRRYILSYSQNSLISSQLEKVTFFGADGASYLPPITFSYSGTIPSASISAEDAAITAQNPPLTVMDNPLVEVADLNRDGLADILQTDMQGSSHTAYVNLGPSLQNNQQTISWSNGQQMTSDDLLALQVHLDEDLVHLADMDGDGIADLIHTTAAGDVQYYTNKGDLSWSARKLMSMQDTSPPAPASSPDIITADLDFDKRIDVMQSTDNGYSIWFNVEEGKYSYETRTSGAVQQEQVVLFSASGFHIVDMNGDRLTDVARVTPTAVIYNAGMGYGSFAAASEIQIPDLILTDGENSQVARAELTDINGDGLADLVLERAAANELWFWLNLGTDSLSEKHVLTGMPTQFGADTVVRWADINGNGTTDLIYADSAAADRLRAIDIGEIVGGTAHPNLLVGIDNGLGVSTTIEYRSSTDYYLQAAENGNPWQTSVPFPLQVVARVTVEPNLDLDGTAGLDQYIKEYIYRDGFYEDKEKQFRGFARVSVIEQGGDSAPTGVTVHDFYTGGPDGQDNDGDTVVDEVTADNHREEDALKGMVRSVQTEAEDGAVFNRTENSWLVKTLLTGTSGTEVRLAYRPLADTLAYEKTAAPETMRTTFLYDDFGNVIEEKNEGALSLNGDEVYTFREYINDTTNWLLGLPQRILVTDASLVQSAETLYYYDGTPYVGLPLGEATQGNLTRQSKWVAGNTYIDSIRNQYDSYGNITSILNANNFGRTITWDTLLHTYPVQESIEVGGANEDLLISAVYNPGLGTLTNSLDFNGNQTSYTYDVFGRLTSLVMPGDSAVLPTKSFTYTLADPLNNLLYSYDASGSLSLTSSAVVGSSVATNTREVSGQPGTFDTVSYIDGLGRPLARVSEGEQGYIVAGAALYNNKGAVRYSFLPYEQSAMDYTVPPMSNYHSETRYDATGRAIEIVNPPDDQAVVTTVATQYLPLSKIVTDENNNQKSSFYDGLSRLITLQENNLGDSYLTSYSYSTTGNLTGIIDAQNNSKTMTYDGLGRKIAMEDPDKGHMEYEFDPNSNLIRTLDNKGQEIHFSYDGADRLVEIDYLDAAGITPDVRYHYDTVSTEYPYAANLKGRLAWQEDLSGGSFYSYDSRGNEDWQIIRIADGESVFNFITDWEYDAMHRIVGVTLPDGDRIAYSYNNGGMLETIPGIVDNIDYTASGQPLHLALTNNITTTYSYDPRQRLTGLLSTDSTQGIAVQDYSYTFDGTGNVMEISDNRTLPALSPRNGSQIFTYDDLYRLTSAEGVGYGIQYQYDRIGNLTFKSSPGLPDPAHIDDPLINLGDMSYGGTAGASNRGPGLTDNQPGPHAVTSTASGLAYSYDSNGNLISRGQGDVLEWDFENRLVRAVTPDSDSTFIYDASGQRRIKKTTENGLTSTDYYISDNFEIRNGQPVKYVFDGSRRIARIENGRLATAGQRASQVLNLTAGWNVIGLNVEPDNSSITSILEPISGKYAEVWAVDPATGVYAGYVPAQGINDLTEMHGGRGYLVWITTPCLLSIPGTRITSPITLDAGWNIVPSPVQSDTPVNQALSSVNGNYSAVWEYDPQTDKWSVYQTNAPSFINDLQEMKPGRSYWLRMSGNGQLHYQQRPGTIYFYHPDHLGSTSLMTDATGSVVEETNYYPFGMPRFESRNGFDSAYKFTGKELDKATGLMYYGARYYDPVVSRFISVDPLFAADPIRRADNPQSLNIYTYSSNNPESKIDPDGLEDNSVLDMSFHTPVPGLEEDKPDNRGKDLMSSQETVNELLDTYMDERLALYKFEKKYYATRYYTKMLEQTAEGYVSPFLSEYLKTLETVTQFAEYATGGTSGPEKAAEVFQKRMEQKYLTEQIDLNYQTLNRQLKLISLQHQKMEITKAKLREQGVDVKALDKVARDVLPDPNNYTYEKSYRLNRSGSSGDDDYSIKFDK